MLIQFGRLAHPVVRLAQVWLVLQVEFGHLADQQSIPDSQCSVLKPSSCLCSTIIGIIVVWSRVDCVWGVVWCDIMMCVCVCVCVLGGSI